LKLLVDQMWPAALAEQLRVRDRDVIAVLERGDLVHQADELIFAWAREERRAVFTENVSDFLPLVTEAIARGEDFFGLVLSSNDTYPRGDPRTLGRAVRALDALMGVNSGESALKNRVEWLAPPPS
jgi:predicted nuclease of predicted toxin-antitoxin system